MGKRNRMSCYTVNLLILWLPVNSWTQPTEKPTSPATPRIILGLCLFWAMFLSLWCSVIGSYRINYRANPGKIFPPHRKCRLSRSKQIALTTHWIISLYILFLTFRKFTPKCSKIVIDFDSINSRPNQKLQWVTSH